MSTFFFSSFPKWFSNGCLLQSTINVRVRIFYLQIRNADRSMCIDANIDSKTDKTVKVYPCHNMGGNQVHNSTNCKQRIIDWCRRLRKFIWQGGVIYRVSRSSVPSQINFLNPRHQHIILFILSHLFFKYLFI